MLGDISTFAAPTTISSQLDTLKTEIQQLQSTNTDGNNPKQYKMPTFQLEKFDDYTHQDPVLWWEAFTTQLRILPVAKHAYIGALFMNSKGGCQIWLTHMAATHDVDVADLKDKITWEELTRLWKKRFIVDDAPALAINRLFTMSQGNTTTRDWLTEWQKIAAVPDLDLPFTHLRRELYNRSCVALSQILGDREQYTTFAEIIDKAREIIKTNRSAAHEKSTWQPTYVEKVRTGPRQRQFAAVQSDNTVEDPAATQASREATPPPTPPDSAALLAASYTSREDANVASPRYTYEDYAVHLVPPLDQPLHVQHCTACTVSSPSATDSAASPSSTIGDSTSWSRLEELDPLTFKDFQWMPQPRSGRLPKPHCNVLKAQLRDYLHTSVPTPLMDTGVEVVDLHAYIAKIDRELKTQRYDDIDASLLYVRIQIGEATCNALIDCGASRNYMNQDFMTIRNVGPLPRIDDLLERLGGAKFFSKLDLKSGYHQLEIRQEDRYKTAFKTRYGHFEWLVMPFGLMNAPTTFQAAMTMEFRHMLDRYVLIYLDDILVYSWSLGEHVEHLRTVLERLRQAKYKANRDKCEFARQELEYLGHYVTPQGIRPLADKIEALRVWPEPTNTTDVRSFMGLAGYYQRFITGYSRIVAPMTRLQSPKVPFVFDDDARWSFQALKTAMLMAPVLSIYDPVLPMRVTTNASGYGTGAVLEQHDGDDWHPVEYFSHKVPPINSLDDARKKELLAFVMTLKRWRHFLLGRRRFTWVTNNNPLTYYKTQDTRHFIRAYESDPDFAILYAQLSSDHPPASHYRIADGYLLLHSRGKDLLCVPRDCRLRTRLLEEYHDSRLAGHFGVNRTIARLRRRFRWPDLITDVTRYCDSYEVCRRSKPRNRNPYGELRPMPIPREPGLSIAMDVTGPFPRNRLGHGGILTVVDRLSKYARFLPCKYYSMAPELACLLHTGWICSHGVPEDIVSDRDTRFMSAFWTALMQESGTKMKPGSALHPQTDGQTERAHQTAQVMLRTLIRPDQKDWADRLPDIEFAYNTSVHPAIGMTPFELHHGGRKGRIFADLLLPQPADIDAACSPASIRKYRELLTQARTNMQKAQVRMQQQANRRRVPCLIRIGDLVWVSAEEFALEQDVSRKLLPKWFGPWSVTSAAGDEPDGPSFVINIPEHLTVHPVFHASKPVTYTPAKSDDFSGRRSQDPPSMDGHQEVDRVISDRKYGSKPRQYKVTFKACDPDDTRWISGADLKASAPLIYAHYGRQRLAKGPPRPAPPTRTVVPPSDRQLRPRR
ncbi:hypothetical protein CBR_g24072 [Chara braunii]|uniref:Integrase catalytic domain-containing protein n=1 Tax=Chara braunii TaxID=69332 RepID=A0A388L5P8_CHABU|nr:hypothetical protein CBR_g24072 [Chara braunii]|eukprot:GBG77626.1 hypothetical protein CBR_g24072 [Chara braunii]